MHDEQNVIHRDLKPDNLLIGDYTDLTQIKIIDFGLACKDNVVGAITDFLKCGTFLYKPPEQMTNNFAYAKKADIWAAGIILYEILTGYHPFWQPGDTKQTLETRMSRFTGTSVFKFPKHVSKHAQHLIKMLCQPSIAGRCKASEALVHPFITRDLNAPLPKSDFESRELALQNLPLESKLRKLIGVVFSCAVIRPKTSTRVEDSESTREETKQSSSLESIDQ